MIAYFSSQVYVAMKLKNLPRERLSLQLYQETDAARLYEEMEAERERVREARERKQQAEGTAALPTAESGVGELPRPDDQLTFVDVGTLKPPGLEVEVGLEPV